MHLEDRRVSFDMLQYLRQSIRSAHDELVEHVQPRDETERAICNALGECSWNECVDAIQRYRTESPARTSDE